MINMHGMIFTMSQVLKNAYDPQTAAGSEAKALKRWHKAVERSMGWADGLD